MNKHDELNRLFAQAKYAPIVASFEETKAAFSKSVVHLDVTTPSKLTTLFNTKFLIMTISGITVLGLSALFFLNKNNSSEKTLNRVLETTKTELSKHTNETKTELLISTDSQLIQKQKVKNLPVKNMEQSHFEPTIIHEFIPSSPAFQKFKNRLLPNEPFFPTLTQKEIDANQKQKKKMVKALAKFDKKSYSYIPAGSFEYEGTTVSVQSFFMQQNEVTNLEYRTFLFDLLIQGRKDDFLIARPDQTQWVKQLGENSLPMQNMYFSDEAYNEYPVVNVSRKGAEMYCIWLTKETNATLKENEKINDARIPTRIEWVKAASYDGKSLPFPWGTESVQNEKHCYLANFDTSTYPEQVSCEVKEMKGSDGALLTAKTQTYNPNYFGLYNMSGNVAEMVYNSKITENNLQMIWDGFGTAGGGWMNTVEEIKIYGPDPYKSFEDAHPGIGFRVVITNMAIRK